MKAKVSAMKPKYERKPILCGMSDCQKPLPGPYGTPGVSLARFDNKTLICSDCGVKEALANFSNIFSK